MRVSHKSRVGKTNNMFFMWLNVFPKNINRRLKTLTFLVVAHKQTAGLNGLQVAEKQQLTRIDSDSLFVKRDSLIAIGLKEKELFQDLCCFYRLPC